MASRGKKKTTMAKLARESRMRERRAEKAARKEARKHAATLEPLEADGQHEGLEDAEGLEVTEPETLEVPEPARG
jgi:hypothetical protein